MTVIKVHSLEWLGNVLRKGGKRTVKKLQEGKPGGGRKKGRPRLRWMDGLALDLEEYGCKKLENKSFGLNRMGICHEGRQSQT